MCVCQQPAHPGQHAPACDSRPGASKAAPAAASVRVARPPAPAPPPPRACARSERTGPLQARIPRLAPPGWQLRPGWRQRSPPGGRFRASRASPAARACFEHAGAAGRAAKPAAGQAWATPCCPDPAQQMRGPVGPSAALAPPGPAVTRQVDAICRRNATDAGAAQLRRRSGDTMVRRKACAAEGRGRSRGHESERGRATPRSATHGICRRSVQQRLTNIDPAAPAGRRPRPLLAACCLLPAAGSHWQPLATSSRINPQAAASAAQQWTQGRTCAQVAEWTDDAARAAGTARCSKRRQERGWMAC
jgi:hypothetical protein